MTDTVCVVGLGYVGLPLAVAFDQEGKDVVGYDVDERKVERLSAGVDTTGDLGDEVIAEGDVWFTTSPSAIGDADYVIVTVPTPIDDMQNPNLAYVEAAGETIGEYVHPGTTIVLESTVFPGATEDVLVPAIEETSGFTAGEEFYVGYSPERASPGDTGRGVRDVRKIVSGMNDEVRDDLVRLYGSIVDAGVYPAPDIQTAETAKVIENVQRDMNIALVNELSIVCENMGLKTEEVLDAAATKWNFHGDYRPGLVGGHCIPVDPFYLVYRSEREGFSPKLILQGREINKYMPKHVADLTLRGLNQCGKVLQESRVLVLGLSYKPNVGDIRTSEISGVIDQLTEFGVEVVGYDPHADGDACRESFGIEVQEELSFEGFDGLVLATAHDEFRSLDLETVKNTLDDEPFIMDIGGAFEESEASTNGFVYKEL